MKSSNIFKSLVLGVVWLCALGDSLGMSLGRPRSVALLGQPLELVVPVQFDTDEKAEGLCFDADVFFGDNKLDASQVLVTVLTVEQDSLLKVRVVSRLAIDEPVVTVYLRGGCLQKSTRKFVLLADLSTDLVVPSLPDSVQVRPATVTTAVPVTATGMREKAAAPSQRANSTTKRMRSVPAGAEAPPANDAEGQAKPPAFAGPSIVRRSRLKLAPIDLATERDPILKLTPEMVVGPSEDLSKRNQAVALWQALNASPQDILRDQARIQSLEGDLKLQREATSKNGQTLQELSARLEQVETQRFANPLVYALSSLLLLSCAGLVYAWTRLRVQSNGTSPWWRGPSSGDEFDDAQDSTFGQPERTTTARKAPATVADQSGTSSLVASGTQDQTSVAEVDIDLGLGLGDSAFANDGGSVAHGKTGSAATDVQPLEVGVQLHRDFSPSALDGLRSMNMQEMLDVRQQAEFFMTLGQYDEAIGLLTASILDSGESNPLVYLELIKALHSLSRKADYDHYRADFNARFTGHIPEYTAFNQSGQDLEAYPNVLLRIAAAWPSQVSLEVIEGCLVRRPDVAAENEFDLDAYRDLLLLHGVGSRILSSSESGPAPFSTAKIDLPQLSDPNVDLMTIDFVTEPVQTPEPLLEILSDPASYAVDLDLSDGASNLMDFDAEQLSERGTMSEIKPDARTSD